MNSRELYLKISGIACIVAMILSLIAMIENKHFYVIEFLLISLLMRLDYMAVKYYE